jgi:pyridoxine 4-dehydrogenase
MITTISAKDAGRIKLGGNLTVESLGLWRDAINRRGYLGRPKDPKTARDVLRRAVDLGVNFIDTSDSYGPEVSEGLSSGIER